MAAFFEGADTNTARCVSQHAQRRQKQAVYLHILLLYAINKLYFGCLWRNLSQKSGTAWTGGQCFAGIGRAEAPLPQRPGGGHGAAAATNAAPKACRRAPPRR